MNVLHKNLNIKSLIYEVRGKQVMLDSDLAYLYGCANRTKDINKAVKRNIERFPSNFYFQLTKEEYEKIKFKELRFQNGTSKIKTRGGRQYIPYAFTEQGVAMLSSVLRTKEAAKVSVDIMNAFVYMRRFINENKDILAKKKVNVVVLLITDENKSRLTNIDINKFNSEYPTLRIKYTNIFHDRFIILDKKELYHIGSSLKDLGKKVFAISKIEDNDYLDLLLSKIKN